MTNDKPPMNNNIRKVCADCGCEIDTGPGGTSYIVDDQGFHHALAIDCQDALKARQAEAVAEMKKIAEEHERKLGAPKP